MHSFSLRVRILLAALVAVPLTPAPASAQIAAGRPSFTDALQAAPAQATAVRRLSIEDAVTLAIEQNLGIRIQRIEPQIQDIGIAQAKSFFAPNFNTGFSRNGQSQRSTSVLLGNSVENANFSSGVGLNQILPWGANYSANWDSSRFTTTNPFNNFSPQLQSTVALNFTQELARNFKIDQIRQQVALSVKSRELSDIQLHNVIVQTTRAVKNAYWDLTYAINNLAAQRQSLELAQRSLKDNQRRVEVGTMAPIDIIQAQAEVAVNEQNVIVADASIASAQDRLRALIFDPDTANFWTTNVEPTDAAPFQAQAIDVDAAVRNALDKRGDFAQARKSMEQSDINIRYFRNQTLPDVSASVRYITSGVGGTQLSPVNFDEILAGGAIPNRTIVNSSGFGTVLGDVFQSSFPNWTVGINIGYPIGSSVAQANLARARLQYQQAQTQLRSLQLQIATQVREVGRQVMTNQQRVRSARASRELQEKKLEAEEKKQAVGLATSFFVFQAQRDLAQARTLEILAIADYNKSLVDFEAVQEVPLGGGGGGITTAGSGALSTGGIVRQ